MRLFAKKSADEKKLIQELEENLLELQREILTGYGTLRGLNPVIQNIDEIFNARGERSDILEIISSCTNAVPILRKIVDRKGDYFSCYRRDIKELHNHLANIIYLQLSLYSPDSKNRKDTKIKDDIIKINQITQKTFSEKKEKESEENFGAPIRNLQGKIDIFSYVSKENVYKQANVAKEEFLKKIHDVLVKEKGDVWPVQYYASLEQYNRMFAWAEQEEYYKNLNEKIWEEFKKIDEETNDEVKKIQNDIKNLEKQKKQFCEPIKKDCKTLIKCLNRIKNTALKSNNTKSYQSIITSFRENKLYLEADIWDDKIKGCKNIIKKLGHSFTGVRKIIRENFKVTLKILEKEKEVEDIDTKIQALKNQFLNTDNANLQKFKREKGKKQKELEKHINELKSLKKKYKIETPEIVDF